MSANKSWVEGSKFLRRLAKACGVMAILAGVAADAARAEEPRAGEIPYQISLQRRSGSTPSRSAGGGGGDIIIFDIVDSFAESRGDDGSTLTLYEAIVDDGETIEMRLILVEESSVGVIRLQIKF